MILTYRHFCGCIGASPRRFDLQSVNLNSVARGKGELKKKKKDSGCDFVEEPCGPNEKASLSNDLG